MLTLRVYRVYDFTYQNRVNLEVNSISGKIRREAHTSYGCNFDGENSDFNACDCDADYGCSGGVC
ncbi:hypothetical protein MTR_3g074510 [Medicago truncatula]|uniref:Uncharacterized protein n=1 Tax=Medicago truncatula TaxID=3880 RepID=A0A072UYT3_MEDTR|nr:hypothetical protein MTR_3g074510 [Medicago truncatula]